MKKFFFLTMGLGTLVLVTFGLAQPPAPKGGEQSKTSSFKNVQVLKNLTPKEMNLEMVKMSEALGVKCDFCHNLNDWGSDAKKEYQTSRTMLRMVQDINANYLTWNGAPKIACLSCHQGKDKPKIPLERPAKKAGK